MAGRLLANARVKSSAGGALVAPLAPAKVLPLRKTKSVKPMLLLMTISSAPSAVSLLTSAPSFLTPTVYLSRTAFASSVLR